jgi:hypothetical protein
MSEVFFIVARISTLIDDLVQYYVALIFLNVKKRIVVFIYVNFIYMFRWLLEFCYVINRACVAVFVFSSMSSLKGEYIMP